MELSHIRDRANVKNYTCIYHNPRILIGTIISDRFLITDIDESSVYSPGHSKYYSKCLKCDKDLKEPHTISDLKDMAKSKNCLFHNRELPVGTFLYDNKGKQSFLIIKYHHNLKNENGDILYTHLYEAECLKCHSHIIDRLSVLKNRAKTDKCEFHDGSRYRWKNPYYGKRYHKIYDRSFNPNCKAYKKYGAVGIVMCDLWKNHPEKFEEWCEEHNVRPGTIIDRIDYNKGYSPDNCQVITQTENVKRAKDTYHVAVYLSNKRYIGMCLTDWCRVLKYKHTKYLLYKLKSLGSEKFCEFLIDELISHTNINEINKLIIYRGDINYCNYNEFYVYYLSKYNKKLFNENIDKFDISSYITEPESLYLIELNGINN